MRKKKLNIAEHSEKANKPSSESTPALEETSPFPLIALFALTLFVSATLVFTLQPLFGKLLLPLLGGSPSVWNGCMVFYQTLLFLGYLYAHLVSSRNPVRRQILIHLAVIVFSLIALPVALPSDAIPPTESNPIPWLLGTLSFAIGLPFFIVSATAPLLQKWFSESGHRESHDPYFLYAASNAGSLIGLLSYPLLIEPNIGLESQELSWSILYLIFGGLVAGCAAFLWRSHSKPSPIETIEPTSQEIAPPSKSTYLYWLFLTLVPSSLLLGVTSFISTDVASVPLLWVIPLALYLLSFIIVFSRQEAKIHPVMVTLQALALPPFIAFSFINPAIIPYWLNLALHLLVFFLAVMVCHGELARHRPHSKYLTLYYLTIAAGGMLGGMFNTFIAPFVFVSVTEYPLMIVAVLLFRPTLRQLDTSRGRQILSDFALPLCLLIAGILLYFSVDHLGPHIDLIGTGLILLAGISFSLRSRPMLLAGFVGALMFLILNLHSVLSDVRLQERTFFGVLSVRENVALAANGKPERFRELWHGTTKHGAQRISKGDQTEPLSYYSRPGPMGQLFSTFDENNSDWKIGLVGLGAGALACYAKPGQTWEFFELDPAVISIALNAKFFSYLKRCAPRASMTPGDARISLSTIPDQTYDLMVLDAFSSDAVPTHLLTREALELYLAKMTADGILAFHITNRHLELKKVLSVLTQDMKIAALLQEFKPKAEKPQIVATDWVVIARNWETLEPLQQSNLGNWRKLPLYFNERPWTDDFTNIIGVWKTDE